MKKFEYKTCALIITASLDRSVYEKRQHLARQLTDIGQEGWELVKMWAPETQIDSPGTDYRITVYALKFECIFKREVEQSKD